MKRLFTDNGFRIVYDTDLDAPIADGFYFTFSYPGLTGEDLLRELLYYGSAPSPWAPPAASAPRACAPAPRSSSGPSFPTLNERLAWFHRDHQGTPGA